MLDHKLVIAKKGCMEGLLHISGTSEQEISTVDWSGQTLSSRHTLDRKVAMADSALLVIVAYFLYSPSNGPNGYAINWYQCNPPKETTNYVNAQTLLCMKICTLELPRVGASNVCRQKVPVPFIWPPIKGDGNDL